jgi:hypothetical protein
MVVDNDHTLNVYLMITLILKKTSILTLPLINLQRMFASVNMKDISTTRTGIIYVE